MEKNPRGTRRQWWRNFWGNIQSNTTVTPYRIAAWIFAAGVSERIHADITESNDARIAGEILAGFYGSIPEVIPADIPAYKSMYFQRNLSKSSCRLRNPEGMTRIFSEQKSLAEIISETFTFRDTQDKFLE